jgi:hypothetical protein
MHVKSREWSIEDFKYFLGLIKMVLYTAADLVFVYDCLAWVVPLLNPFQTVCSLFISLL